MLAIDENMWINATDVQETSTDWLWWPYIAAENINIIAGMGNEGKGLVCTHLAACVTRGRSFPISSERHDAANVVWCEMEDDLGSTIKPRLMAARADLTKVTLLKPDKFIDRLPAQRLDVLGEIIAEKQPRLMILSPMNSFLGEININNELEVRKVFEEIRNYTVGTGCAIIGIAHANKKSELSAIERISGSVAYVNFCRSVLFVKSEEHAEDPNTRRMIHGKWNMSTRGPDILYSSYYDGADPKQRDQYIRLKWEAPLTDIDHKKAFADMDVKEKDKENVGDWVIRYLKDNGPTPVAKLKEEVTKAKKRWGSVEQARLRLNDRHGDIYIDSTDGVWTLGRRSF